jgi:GT2 family glycosyltransferase
VSVIVASHRKDYVKALAAAFLAFTDATAELIVVADYPVYGLAQEFPWAIWIYHDDAGISAKRNRGCREARGDVFAFIDDDCVPLEDWLDKGMRYLEAHPQAGGVEGKTILDAGQRVAAPMGEFKRLELRGYRTNNIFYRKKVFFEAGGFDERFTKQREDADLAYGILSRGYDIGYCAEAVVRHRVRHNERWDLLKNCINRRFDPLLYKKHPALYRRHVGTPFTPAIGVLLVCDVLLVFFVVACPEGWPGMLCADLAAALALSVRRNTQGNGGLMWVARDWLSFVLAPLVLTGALAYGSVKFRRFLLF